VSAGDTPLTAPAAERNKEPILTVLRHVLPRTGLALEIASGTGQHVVHFAQALPDLTWQPSDPDPDLRASIRARAARASLPNLRAPLDLDVCRRPWPIETANAVLCINMVHIAPWFATTALMAGASQLLPAEGVLVLYGPFRREGRHTAPSNEAFDRHLRSGNPDWGVRDLEAVTEVASCNGRALRDMIAMPANNLCIVFRPATVARAAETMAKREAACASSPRKHRTPDRSRNEAGSKRACARRGGSARRLHARGR